MTFDDAVHRAIAPRRLSFGVNQGDVVNQSPVVISGDAATACGLWHALLARKLRFNFPIGVKGDQCPAVARVNHYNRQSLVVRLVGTG